MAIEAAKGNPQSDTACAVCDTCRAQDEFIGPDRVLQAHEVAAAHEELHGGAHDVVVVYRHRGPKPLITNVEVLEFPLT